MYDAVTGILQEMSNLRRFHFQLPDEWLFPYIEAPKVNLSADPVLELFTKSPVRNLQVFEVAGRCSVRTKLVCLDAFLKANPWVKLIDLSSADCRDRKESTLYTAGNEGPSLPMLKHLRVNHTARDIFFARDLPSLRSVSVDLYDYEGLDPFQYAIGHGPFHGIENFEIEDSAMRPLCQDLLELIPPIFPEIKHFSLSCSPIEDRYFEAEQISVCIRFFNNHCNFSI
jgi:hypothetical protein